MIPLVRATIQGWRARWTNEWTLMLLPLRRQAWNSRNTWALISHQNGGNNTSTTRYSFELRDFCIRYRMRFIFMRSRRCTLYIILYIVYIYEIYTRTRNKSTLYTIALPVWMLFATAIYLSFISKDSLFLTNIKFAICNKTMKIYR